LLSFSYENVNVTFNVLSDVLELDEISIVNKVKRSLQPERAAKQLLSSY